MPTVDASIVEQYYQQGDIVVEGLVSPSEVDVLRQRTADIADGRVPYPKNRIEIEPGGDEISLATVRKINKCADNDSVFRTHAGHERILDVAEALIGPDIKLFSSQCFMKPPGGIEKTYHQDSAYFTIEPMALVTCWTVLDDVTLENGPLWVIPASQHRGLVDHSEKWMVRDRQDRKVPDALIDRESALPIIMPAGSCSFHHSLLLHGSTPNRSNRSRRGMAVHYMTASSRWTDTKKTMPKYELLRGREYEQCV